MFLTLPGLLVPLNVVINRSHSPSPLLAPSVETLKRGIFCILLTQCCNAAIFCNELQCHNSCWSGVTVTFLKPCEPYPCSLIISMLQCAGTQNMTRQLYCTQNCIHCRLLPWRKCSALTESCILLVFLPSYLFICIPYQPVTWLVGALVGTPGNCCLKYFVLLLRRLGNPRPVLSPSASRVGFSGSSLQKKI